MTEFSKEDIPGSHGIISDYTLHCAETGRVVAVFYNEHDLYEVLEQISNTRRVNIETSLK